MNWFQKLLCKLFRIGCPPSPPPGPPPPCRQGLLFGYFGTQLGQPAQTMDHVNLAHIGSWGDWSTPQGRADLMDAMVMQAHQAVSSGITRIMFTIDWCLLTPTNPRELLPESTAVSFLTTFVRRIIGEGLAPYTYAWYVVDEPNIPEVALSAAEVTTICTLVRTVTNGSPVESLPLCTTYGTGNNDRPGIDMFDWVGIDNYGANVTTNGQYAALVAHLRPDQHTVLIPGGSDPWREDPRTYYDWAQGDQRVVWIMPFMWFSPTGGNDAIDHNGMAPQYQAIGRLVKAATP